MKYVYEKTSVEKKAYYGVMNGVNQPIDPEIADRDSQGVFFV